MMTRRSHREYAEKARAYLRTTRLDIQGGIRVYGAPMSSTYHRESHNATPSALTLRYLWLFSFVGASVTVIDALISGQSLFQMGLSAGLGFGAALVIGGLSTLIMALLTKAPRSLFLTVWMVLGLILGLLLAHELNAFVRLTGPHRTLAIITLAATSVCGLTMGALCALIQPTSEPDVALWRRLSGLLRWSLTGVMLVGGVVTLAVERSILVGLYPMAHTAMWIIGLWAITVSITLGLADRQAPIWMTRPSWLIGLALLLNAFMFLHKSSDETVHALQGTPTASFALNTLRSMTDVDGDNYSSLLGGGDCAAFDANVNPSAKEIPGNGVDDNCHLGDAPPPQDDQQALNQLETNTGTSVVLITVDTVRPDHLNLYGYHRNTTPNLNRFAARSVVFDRAYSASAWTSLAVSALMRGLYPRRIEWTKVYETSRYRLVREAEKDNLQPGEKLRLMFTMPLDDPREPLAKQLQRRGIYTAAVVDDGYGEFLSPKMGLAAGFDRFDTAESLPKKKRTDRGTVNMALKTLRSIPRGKDFFLWVHLFGPHDPNSRHRGIKNFGKTQVDQYDHELLYADRQLGRLLAQLRIMGRYRPIAIALTSDHGEQFFKHRRYHGVNLTEANIRVLLIISHPDT